MVKMISSFKWINNYNSRFFIILLLIILAFLALIIRMFYLYDGDNQVQFTSTSSGQARVDIIDRNKEILATNLLTYNLYVEPAIIRDKNNIIKDLKIFFQI